VDLECEEVAREREDRREGGEVVGVGGECVGEQAVVLRGLEVDGEGVNGGELRPGGDMDVGFGRGECDRVGGGLAVGEGVSVEGYLVAVGEGEIDQVEIEVGQFEGDVAQAPDVVFVDGPAAGAVFGGAAYVDYGQVEVSEVAAEFVEVAFYVVQE